VEQVVLSTEDGLELAAWYLPGERGVATVVFPGNAGDRSARLPLAARLNELGSGVLLVDYRGYAGNPGKPSEEGLARDARTAAGYLAARDDVTEVVYFGESLGAAVATGLAMTDPPAALILRSPFSSLPAIARHHLPWVPTALLRDRYPVAEQLSGLDVPTLVLVPVTDEIVPPDQSMAVAAAAGDRARVVFVPAAHHNDPALLDGDDMVEAIANFLAEHSSLEPHTGRDY
jgi:fermentation-respiration switch protein FrsA (DUF1100 family)